MKFHKLHTLIENVFQPASVDDLKDRKRAVLKKMGLVHILWDDTIEKMYGRHIEDMTFSDNKLDILYTWFTPNDKQYVINFLKELDIKILDIEYTEDSRVVFKLELPSVENNEVS